jgi:endonuclease YncB( thermonuclease family)
MSRILQNLGLLVVFALLAVFAYIFWQQNQPNSSPSATPTSGKANKPTQTNPTMSPNPDTSKNANPPMVKSGDYNVIFGEFVIIGKQPDGDSLRFKADNASLLAKLKNASRLKESKDGTVQLRFEGIDAPELHYGGTRQPMGRESRDRLLEWMGFRNVRYQELTVSGSSPERVRGAIMSSMVERNGRPVAYVFGNAEATGLKDGSSIRVDDTRLRLTLNALSLEKGMSYFTVYNSMPQAQINTFKALANKARTSKLGIWARDKTSEFTLENSGSINDTGQLILPKLFRRATDYLNAKRKNRTNASFKNWLIESRNTPNPQDGLLLEQGNKKRLSDLIEENGSRVRFKADTLELVFNE